MEMPIIYGGISFPSQSQNFPLLSTPNFPTTPTSLSAANSGLNSLSSFTFPQNSLLRPVLTVPGCNDIAIAFSPDRVCNRLSNVLVSWFTAALELRYENHPPRRLSVMDPTRADMLAHTALRGMTLSLPDARSSGEDRLVFLVGKNRSKCFIISSGPRAFVRYVRSAFSASTWAGDFSGKRMPGTQKLR